MYPKSLSVKGGSSEHDEGSEGVDYSSNANTNTHTFRDTEIEEIDASNIMKIQNISSILNDPKSDNFLK